MNLVTTLGDTRRSTQSHPQGVWLSLLHTLRVWRRRSRERAELARFSLRELQDIGLSSADAMQEINKPVWRA